MANAKFPDIVVTMDAVGIFKGDQYKLVNFGCEVLKEKLSGTGRKGKEIGKIINEWLSSCRAVLAEDCRVEDLFPIYFATE